MPSIFIVEDEVIVADDIRETLTSLGYEVAGTAKSGTFVLIMGIMSNLSDNPFVGKIVLNGWVV